MKTYYSTKIKISLIAIFLCMAGMHTVRAQTTATSFKSTDLRNATVGNPTSLQFGPDGKLYVVQQDGLVRIFDIIKDDSGYKVTSMEVVDLVKKIPNYNDDGTFFNVSKRQSTGILVAGTAAAPVVYVSSSDYRIGAGQSGDVNLNTNSGVISRLTKENGTWKKVDIVRGLPRSEENHAPNGMQLWEENGKKTLLISIGGSTNAGGPSKLWTYISEYALSSAILAIDLTAIEQMPVKYDTRNTDPAQQAYIYDIPTLDDPTRTNNPGEPDPGDPWGGNDGLNQAKIVPGGPVQVFSPGFRNAYDVLISKFPGREGRVYTIDNGPNGNWGGYPADNGKATINNKYPEGEPGSLTVGNYDGLELIGNIRNYSYGSYYGGHPVPIRANPSGAGLLSDNGTYRGWRNDNSDPNLPLPSDWPPVPVANNPFLGDTAFHNPGTPSDKSLIYWETSTNGFCEYLYSKNEFYGDLFAAAYDDGGNIFWINMDTDNNVANKRTSDPKKPSRVDGETPIFSGFGNKPLDITAQGDGEKFEGTIWVATWGANKITVFEPKTITCPASLNPTGDEDGDGYTNGDEKDNGTNPCSASSKPQDYNNNGISDLHDNDDDSDGITDDKDLFALDKNNGLKTYIPTHYALFNYDPGTGFFGVGFTGLMCNGTTDYLDLYDPANMISGGAAGAVTITEVPAGDALEGRNNQQYAFQFGVNVKQYGKDFTVKSAVMPIYFNQKSPVDDQTQGLYIGTGDQDNYIKIVAGSYGGKVGVHVFAEDNGAITYKASDAFQSGTIPAEAIIFYLMVDPADKLVYAKYAINDPQQAIDIGDPIPLTGKLLDAITKANSALAVGIISTSRTSGQPFSATWDYIEVYEGMKTTGTVSSVANPASNPDNISLYPNPGKDKVMVTIDSRVPQNYRVRFFNSAGQEIKVSEMSHTSPAASHELDISDLDNGIYYLHFISEKENRYSAVKLIKK